MLRRLWDGQVSGHSSASIYDPINNGLLGHCRLSGSNQQWCSSVESLLLHVVFPGWCSEGWNLLGYQMGTLFPCCFADKPMTSLEGSAVNPGVADWGVGDPSVLSKTHDYTFQQLFDHLLMGLPLNHRVPLMLTWLQTLRSLLQPVRLLLSIHVIVQRPEVWRPCASCPLRPPWACKVVFSSFDCKLNAALYIHIGLCGILELYSTLETQEIDNVLYLIYPVSMS